MGQQEQLQAAAGGRALAHGAQPGEEVSGLAGAGVSGVQGCEQPAQRQPLMSLKNGL